MNPAMKLCSPWRWWSPAGSVLTAAAVILAALLLTPADRLQAAPAATTGKRTQPRFAMIKLARGPMNRLLLSATIDGKEGMMQLDTGAGVTLLDSDKYKFLLPGPGRPLPAGLPAKIKVNGHDLRVGFARELKIGSVNLGSFPLVVGDRGMFWDVSGLSRRVKVDGVLGEDLLRSYRAIVDCQRLILYLTLDSNPKKSAGPALVAAGWTRVPMSNLGTNFTVECQLGKHRYRLLVDTGAPFTALDSGLVTAEGIRTRDLPLTSGFVGTPHQKTQLVGQRSLVIGQYVARNMEIIARRDLISSLKSNLGGNPPLLGVLGGDTLAQNHAVIDIGDGCLYLKAGPPGGKKP